MKRILTLALFVLLGFAVKAQTPDVTIAVTDTTATTVTASFTPNGSCTSYYILLGTADEMTGWAQMMQCSLATLVMAWGVAYTQPDTYTWTELTPATEYTIYVAAIGGNDTVLLTRTASTLSQGGGGSSAITIQVTDITDNSARVICTPNSETSVFYDQVIEKSYYEEIGADSAMSIVQASPYPQYAVDNWVWSGLDAGTSYFALAIGQNANGQWGEMAKMEFSTTSNGLEDNTLSNFRIYPNPATDVLNIEAAAGAKELQVVNLLGQTIFRETVTGESTSINVSQWSDGIYLIRLQSDAGIATRKFVKR